MKINIYAFSIPLISGAVVIAVMSVWLTADNGARGEAAKRSTAMLGLLESAIVGYLDEAIDRGDDPGRAFYGLIDGAGIRLELPPELTAGDAAIGRLVQAARTKARGSRALEMLMIDQDPLLCAVSLAGTATDKVEGACLDAETLAARLSRLDLPAADALLVVGPDAAMSGATMTLTPAARRILAGLSTTEASRALDMFAGPGGKRVGFTLAGSRLSAFWRPLAGTSSRLVLVVADRDLEKIVRRERLYFLTVVVLYAAVAVALMVWSGRRARRGLARTEDISRRLRDSQERFRDAVESVSDWIWEIDEDRQFTYSSWRARAAIGLDPASVIGKRHDAVFADACDADDPSKSPRHLNYIAEGRAFRDVRFIWHGGGNGPRHLAISGKPVYGEDDAVIGYRGSVSDITGQVAREESLKVATERMRRSHQMLIDAIEAVPVAFRLYDSDGRLVLWNSKARDFFSGLAAFVTPGADLDRAIEALANSGKVCRVQPTDEIGEEETKAPRAVSENMLGALRRNHAGSEPFDMALTDGRYIRTAKHQTADGGCVIVNIDYTAMRTMTAALVEAKREAEAANLAKSRFLAAASHDLKQPLHAIALMVGTLAALVRDPDQQKLVDDIEASLRATEEMYCSILDISKLDAGVLVPDVVNVPLGNLFAILAQEFTPEGRQRGLSLKFVDTSAVVRTDPSMLARILRNLISNALKYTATGRILVGCRRRDGTLTIQVWDTGQGIPDDEIGRIFDEFYQVEHAGRALIRGLGLGLSIVERTAKLLGHQVSVRSKPGVGTVFSVTVSLSPATEVNDDNLKRAQR